MGALRRLGCCLVLISFVVSLLSNSRAWKQLQSQPIARELSQPGAAAEPSIGVGNNNGNNNNEEGISACMLLMDDNHFLIEWLAFHYHHVRLRHLVVAVDPRSRTSPTSILERWKDRMDIQTWDDSQIFANETVFSEAKEWVNLHFERQDMSEDLVLHRTRQRLFYHQCLLYHQEQGHSWTLLIDPDEFISVNYDSYPNLRPSLPPPPSIQSPDALYDVLQRERSIPREFNNITASPCIQIPRRRFGIVPSDTDSWASMAATQRWRYHSHRRNFPENRIAKTMVNVQEIPFIRVVDSIHRPVKPQCSRAFLHIREHKQAFVIAHFLGTMQQYGLRRDARAGTKERGIQKFEKSAKLQEGYSEMLVPWIDGFVDTVGLDTAKKLLDGVGIPG